MFLLLFKPFESGFLECSTEGKVIGKLVESLDVKPCCLVVVRIGGEIGRA